MKRKKKGVGDLIVCMITILAMFAILIFGIDLFKTVSLAIQKEQIQRIFLILVYKRHVLEYNYSYINNSLTQAMNELINELTALGVTDISLSGTTMSPAGYGNAIYLVVTGHISVPGKTGLDGWRWIKRNEAVGFRINQKSIAKY